MRRQAAASPRRCAPSCMLPTSSGRKSSEKCLGCGACTYLCPTCYCFNITDEQGTRQRASASGAGIPACSPTLRWRRAATTRGRAKSQRLKNRVGHKFVWYPEVHDEPACSGCGRCIRHCPVSMEISRIVTLLSGSTETGADREEKRGAA